MQKKSLVIARFLNASGVTTYLRELRLGLPTIGYLPHFWVSDFPAPVPQDVTALRLPIERHLNFCEAFPGLFDFRHFGSRRAVEALRPGQFDIVHLNDINGGWFSLKAACSICKKFPTVWAHHDESASNGFVYQFTDRVPKSEFLPYLPPLYRLLRYSPYHTSFKSRMWNRFYDRNSPQPTLHICMVRYTADLLTNSGRYNPDRIRIVRNGISLFDNPGSQISRAEAREKMGLPNDRPIVMLMGSNCRDVNKGMHLGAQAIRRTFQTKRFHVLVLGKHAESVRRLLGGVSATYEFVTSQDRLAHAYRSSDITVVPSLMETYPFVAKESLACGTPVISFRVGGLIDILQEGKHGRLVTPYDTHEMSNAIIELLENPALAEQLGQTGLQWIRTYCSNAAMSRNLLAVYEEAQEIFRREQVDQASSGGG